MHVYSNMKNILIFIVGCIALYYTFPNELFIPGIKEIDSNIIWIITLLYPFFLAHLEINYQQEKDLLLEKMKKNKFMTLIQP